MAAIAHHPTKSRQAGPFKPGKLSECIEHLCRERTEAQGIICSLELQQQELQKRLTRCKHGISERKIRQLVAEAREARTAANIRLEFSKSYARELIERAQVLCFEDAWQEHRVEINKIVGQCSAAPGGSTAYQQISFAQRQSMRRYNEFLVTVKRCITEHARAVVSLQRFVVPDEFNTEFQEWCYNKEEEGSLLSPHDSDEDDPQQRRVPGVYRRC